MATEPAGDQPGPTGAPGAGSDRSGSDAPANGSAPGSRIVLVVAILASFVAFLDGSIVNVALPAIQNNLGGGVTLQQWVVDAYLLTLGSLMLVAGSLSDTFGRVRILRLGLIFFALFSVGAAFAPTSGLLIAARGLEGVAAALLVASLYPMLK